MALVDAFIKEKVPIEAFFGHYATSRKFVDSSNADTVICDEGGHWEGWDQC